MADKEAIKAFYEDYAELCYMHKMHIGSCGCCGSPWIYNGMGPESDIPLSDDVIEAHLSHIREESEVVENEG